MPVNEPTPHLLFDLFLTPLAAPSVPRWEIVSPAFAFAPPSIFAHYQIGSRHFGHHSKVASTVAHHVPPR